MKYVIGIDPSIKNMGFSIISIDKNDNIIVEYAKTFDFDNKESVLLFQKIADYYFGQLWEDFHAYHFAAIAYESNPFGNKLIQLGQRRAIGFIQGVACAYRLNIPIVGIHSSHVKAVFGNGRATKEETIAKVKARFGIDCDEHSADSVAVAYCYWQDYQAKERIKLAKKQQKKLRGVK